MQNKTITINTIQGIGDLIWVYRKLSPLYENIHLNILVIANNKIQQRSKQFLRTLDQVKTINYKLVSLQRYNQVAHGIFTLENLIDGGDYSVNAWLEKGIHIEHIDKDYPVNWDISLKQDPCRVRGDYVLLYVSGCAHNSSFYQMSSSQWAGLALYACNKLHVKNCILIGAPYDHEKLIDIKRCLNVHINSEVITHLNIKATTSLINQAKYFIAYQSGLCVIAEELKTPTFMVYFPENCLLMSSWLRRESLEMGLFKNTCFGVNIKKMNDLLNDHIDEIQVKGNLL